jgi:anion-transporting  ArsA/GET3 family ATPase
MRPADPGGALEAALRKRRVLVVCGSGGVGKTTISAALALRAARDGRRALVCTIDPARRLATRLGLGRLSGTPQRVELDAPGGAGELWAMTLDVKRTFDELVIRHAGSPEAARRILDNALYREVSAALAGSHEYMAMEKLLELHGDERFDLVVLDTPPTRHALDFLEAPDRMLSFLDTSVLRFFLKPYLAAGRLTLRAASRTGAALLRLADRVLGLELLRDLSEFFLAFDGMYEGFKDRAGRVFELLRSGRSGFVVVTSPTRQALQEATFLRRQLAERDMPCVAVVVNRVLGRLPAARGGSGRVEVPPALRSRLVAIFRDHNALAAVEERGIRGLEVDCDCTALRVPELDDDASDLPELVAVAGALLSGRDATSRRRLP